MYRYFHISYFLCDISYFINFTFQKEMSWNCQFWKKIFFSLDIFIVFTFRVDDIIRKILFITLLKFYFRVIIWEIYNKNSFLFVFTLLNIKQICILKWLENVEYKYKYSLLLFSKTGLFVYLWHSELVSRSLFKSSQYVYVVHVA